ncbi:MAG: hypothetical protein J0H68_03870 [Sphingobacteriia bacterium]|nr:hypothetical protein [Sphingobacteriia bacterium]
MSKQEKIQDSIDSSKVIFEEMTREELIKYAKLSEKTLDLAVQKLKLTQTTDQALETLKIKNLQLQIENKSLNELVAKLTESIGNTLESVGKAQKEIITLNKEKTELKNENVRLEQVQTQMGNLILYLRGETESLRKQVEGNLQTIEKTNKEVADLKKKNDNQKLEINRLLKTQQKLKNQQELKNQAEQLNSELEDKQKSIEEDSKLRQELEAERKAHEKTYKRFFDAVKILGRASEVQSDLVIENSNHRKIGHAKDYKIRFLIDNERLRQAENDRRAKNSEAELTK